MAKSPFDPTRVLGVAFGARMLYAHMAYAQQLDRHVSLAEFGEAVAHAEARLTGEKITPYSASSVSRWEGGTEPSRGATILAVCSLLKGKVDPGWLHYGEASKAPTPPEQVLTLADIAAARAGGRRGRRS